MTTASMARFDALCRDKCLEPHVSVLGLADLAGGRRGADRVGSSSVALSDVFGRIAEALGADAEPLTSRPSMWPASHHRAGTA